MPGSSPYLLQPGQGGYNGPVSGGGGGNPYDPSANPYANVDPGGNADPNTQSQNAQNYWQTLSGTGSASANWGGRVDTLDQNPLATPAGTYMQAEQAGNQQAQQQSYLQAQQLAQGKGPSLATQLLQQNANQAMGNQNAMASSASGSGSALARRQAMMSNANTMQGLGAAASSARAQEQLGAMQMQGQLAGQGRAQDLALAGGETGMVQNQANLNLGSEGMAQGQQQFEQGRMDKYIGAVTSGAGAMFGFDAHLGGDDAQAPGPTGSSLHLKEPNGPSHWILREEPNFLLAVNARTGEHRKILTAPLTPDEHRQATAKHGAGPMGSYNPGNIYTGDFDMAQMSQWSGAGQDNTGPASSYPTNSAAPSDPSKKQNPTSQKGQAGKLIAGGQTPGSSYAKDYMVDLQKSPLVGGDVSLGGSRRLMPQDDEVVQSAMDNADPNTSPKNGYVPMEYWGNYLSGKPAASDYNWVNGPHRGSKLNREAAYEPVGIQRKEKESKPVGDYSSPRGDLRAADVSLGGGQADYAQQFRQSYDSADDATPAAKVGGGSTNNSIGALTGADANLGGRPAPAPAPQTGADAALAGMGYNPGGYGLKDTQNAASIYTDPKMGSALVKSNKEEAQKKDIAVERLKQEDIDAQKAQGFGDYVVQPNSVYMDRVENPWKNMPGNYAPEQEVKGISVKANPYDQGDSKIYDVPKGLVQPFVDENIGTHVQKMPTLEIEAKPPKKKPAVDPAHPDAVAADLHIGGQGYHPTRPQVGKNPLASMMPKTGGATRGLTSFYSSPKLDKPPKTGASLMTQKFGKKSKAA